MLARRLATLRTPHFAIGAGAVAAGATCLLAPPPAAGCQYTTSRFSPPAVFESEPGLCHFLPNQDHWQIKDIAASCRYYSPKYSPKAVPAFYDLSGITENPAVFQLTVDLFVERYREQIKAGNGPTVVVGYDARGFVLGPPIALALKLPFVLLRKAGKNPGPLVTSSAYSKEYKEQQPDKMCVRLGALVPEDRVLLIDDLIATGGTAISGFELCSALGVAVHEFAAIIELPYLGPDFPSPHPGVKMIRAWEGGKFSDVPIFTVVDDGTIASLRPAADDPPDAVPCNVDMADAKQLLADHPSLRRC